MQETYDLQTIIIIFTFLGILIGISFLINRKKDFLKSHIKNKNFINVINTSLLGGGNRIILFEVYNKKYFVVVNKSNISNITLTESTGGKNRINQPMVVRNEKTI